MEIRQIFFIDARVADYQSLIAGLPADSEWILLKSDQDGIEQMRSALTGYRNLDSIQILSHGAEASLQLGATTLTAPNLESYQSQVGWVWRTSPAKFYFPDRADARPNPTGLPASVGLRRTHALPEPSITLGLCA